VTITYRLIQVAYVSCQAVWLEIGTLRDPDSWRGALAGDLTPQSSMSRVKPMGSRHHGETMAPGRGSFMLDGEVSGSSLWLVRPKFLQEVMVVY